MDFVPDLDAYLTRIGDDGSRAPALATLHRIVAAHTRSIPFENLDVLLGKGIDLEPERVERKLVHERRGGYCFEQNTLLLRALQALGFQAAALSARVRYQRPRDYTPPRTHVFVRVEVDGVSWLADVGVGGLSLTAALRLDTESEQPTPHEPRRIVREGGLYFHQVLLEGTWQDVYEFTLEEMPSIDRELANWYTSAHPGSHFKNQLLVARATPDGRKTLLNRELTLRKTAGHVDRRTVATPDELLEVLDEHFGLSFPTGVRFACTGLDWG